VNDPIASSPPGLAVLGLPIDAVIAERTQNFDNNKYQAYRTFMMEAALRNLAIAGLFFAVLVAFRVYVLPLLLRMVLGVKEREGKPTHWQDRVELRYQKLHTFIWMFAWFKLRLDPMFQEIPEFLAKLPKIRTALDLGCGYGFAGTSMLTWNSDLRLYGMDPNPERVIAASKAFGERGHAFAGGAPDFELPQLPARLDAVFILDVIHFLSDEDLDLTLRRVRARLDDGAPLLIRAPMKPAGFGSIAWNIDKIRRRLTGSYACYRTVEQVCAAIDKAGFKMNRSQMSGKSDELHWFIAIASSAKKAVRLQAGSKLAEAGQHDENDQSQESQVGADHPVGVPLTELVPPL
jgi:SAM-dependent methyltransferase